MASDSSGARPVEEHFVAEHRIPTGRVRWFLETRAGRSRKGRRSKSS
jgi:hypothetical protein